MSESANCVVTIHILNKAYQFKCLESEQDKLQQAALMLDAKMREIHEHSHVNGTERIAVMAALNVCHELLEIKDQQTQHSGENKRYITKISEKIAQTLTQTEQLEL